MAKRKGNREARKPKQDKQEKTQAATSVSAIGATSGRVAPDRADGGA